MELSIFLMRMGLYLFPDPFSPEKEGQDRGTCKPREPKHLRLIPDMSFSTSPCLGFPISLSNPQKAVEVFSLPGFGSRCCQSWEQLKGREEAAYSSGSPSRP